jgi:hypothetical protein
VLYPRRGEEKEEETEDGPRLNICIDYNVISHLVFVCVICLLLEFFSSYMRGNRDSPHQAGVFTRGEGSRYFVMATKWLNKIWLQTNKQIATAGALRSPKVLP